MAGILFLYDTKETDLARDFRDLLAELDISLTMIPLAADAGMSLEQKEKIHFNLADGVIFLVTPGSERGGIKYPSPSVSHELGQAKQKFSGKPESVICIVEEPCKLPSIEQITYISLNRQDIRSIISALTQLFRDLKVAGFLPITIPQPEKPIPYTPAQPEKILSSLSDHSKSALFHLCGIPNGNSYESEFRKFLSEKLHISSRDINFLKRELLEGGLIFEYVAGSTPAVPWLV